MRAFVLGRRVADNSCGDAFKHVYRIVYDPRANLQSRLDGNQVRLWAISNSASPAVDFCAAFEDAFARWVRSIINSLHPPWLFAICRLPI